MNDADKALASVGGIHHLLMKGKDLHRNLADALTGATAAPTIDGAPTLTLVFEDPHREILRSGVFGRGVKCNLDAYPFEIVQVSKSASSLTVTFEHEAAAALRRHNDPLKVAPGVMTHVQFARRLVHEERWLQFVTGGKGVVSKTALTRGTPAGSGKHKHLKREDSWTALGRLAADRGWRRFIVGASELYYCTDEWLFGHDVSFVVREDRDGVDNIDFDYDAGKPVAEVKVTARAGRWKVPPGRVVQVKDCGPADGKWLVVAIDRNLFTTTATVTLHKPQPTLPEPKPQATSSSGGSSSSGGLPSTHAGSGASTATDFVNTALGEVGKPYVWGGESPSGFDCSGLVQWSANKIGVVCPRTSGEQYAFCKAKGTTISVDKAEHTKGALLFEGVSGSQHVAISLGDGRTIEAMGVAYGVNRQNAIGRGWTGAGLLPGLEY